ncbi:MAG: hypothetical protein M3439_03950 [Chloroflexota bacterium]|nr:hypothetical protein [Chloroflexota bacterium]
MSIQPRGRGPGSLILSTAPAREHRDTDRHSGSRLTRRKRATASRTDPGGRFAPDAAGFL